MTTKSIKLTVDSIDEANIAAARYKNLRKAFTLAAGRVTRKRKYTSGVAHGTCPISRIHRMVVLTMGGATYGIGRVGHDTLALRFAGNTYILGTDVDSICVDGVDSRIFHSIAEEFGIGEMHFNQLVQFADVKDTVEWQADRLYSELCEFVEDYLPDLVEE